MSWWARLIRRRRLEEQLEKELRFHLEQHTAELIGRGYSATEARRQAALALGGPEQVKENCRDARGTRWLEDLAQDLRYAWRALRQQPGFAAVALLTLALGTGATTVMFTLVNSVLLKPLPYRKPDRLVSLQEKTTWHTQWGNLWAFTYPNFLDCQSASRSLEMAAWRYAGGTLSAPGDAEYVDGFEISYTLLPVLDVSPFLGRGFLPQEDRLGGAPVALVSYELWQRKFGAETSMSGKTLVFNGKNYTVVGVMRPDFRLGGDTADVFLPIGESTEAVMRDRGAHPGIRVWGRLAPGATLAQAATELNLIGQHLAEQYPKTNQGRTFIAAPLRPDVQDVRSTLWLLSGAVSLVLLIACVNVSSLLLARAVSRERELATRLALGASRGRLVRQCLTESALLGLLGGALGTVLAESGLRPFVKFWPGSLPRAEEVQLDWHVLLFALAASLVCGLLFGLAPALRAPSRELEQTLRAGGRTMVGSSRRAHSVFVVSEVALAVVLLVTAGMLGRMLLRLASLDPGINVRNVLVTRAALSPHTLASPASIRAGWEDFLNRVRTVPAVESVAMVDTIPMREGNNAIGYWTSAAQPPEREWPLALANSVTPDYVRVMGLRLRQGRFFDQHDRIGSQGVVVIDDVLARQAFGRQNPLGKQLWIDLGNDPVRVVGVVGHVRYWGARDDLAQIRAQLYYPFAQVPDRYLRRWSELMSIAVRTRVPPLNTVEALRHAVRGATNDQVLYEVHTMEQLASESLARQRFLALLFGTFAGAALLLACIGIYGVMAYLTSQRVPEIGVRMALGASARDVLRLVLRQSLTTIFVGVIAGAAAAFAAARVLVRLVEGMQPSVLSSFALTIPLLILSASIAGFIPARRASRIDPLVALRQE
jgi:predicted permease